MKITDKMISLPPYLSTSWKNIASIQMKNNELVITLQTSEVVRIPNLSVETIETIFHMHAQYLETEEKAAAHAQTEQGMPHKEATSSFKNLFDSMGNFGSMLTHNPEQADSPNLPADIIEKITMLAKKLPRQDALSIPEAEPHCNCFHCQITRAIFKGINEENAEDSSFTDTEPEVKDEDLAFQEWEVVQTGNDLYSVTNKLDPTEKYQVYLGTPVGCTCGKQHCEHILAVLKS